MKESNFRSIIKTSTWRIIASLTTMIIAYFVTEDVLKALSIGSVEFFAKMILYYLHERGWLLVQWGKNG